MKRVQAGEDGGLATGSWGVQVLQSHQEHAASQGSFKQFKPLHSGETQGNLMCFCTGPICSVQHLLMCCRTASWEQWLDLSLDSFHTPRNAELSPFNDSSVAITCATKMRLSLWELLLNSRV